MSACSTRSQKSARFANPVSFVAVGEPRELLRLGAQFAFGVAQVADVLHKREPGPDVAASFVMQRQAGDSKIEVAVGQRVIELRPIARERCPPGRGELLVALPLQYLLEQLPVHVCFAQPVPGERLSLGHQHAEIVVEHEHGDVRQVAGKRPI